MNMFENNVYIHVLVHPTSWDQFFYLNINFLSIWSFAVSYFLLNDLLTVSYIDT